MSKKVKVKRVRSKTKINPNQSGAIGYAQRMPDSDKDPVNTGRRAVYRNRELVGFENSDGSFLRVGVPTREEYNPSTGYRERVTPSGKVVSKEYIGPRHRRPGG